MCLESNWLFTSTKRVIHHDIVNIVIFLAQQAIEQKDANLNVTSILEAQESSITLIIHTLLMQLLFTTLVIAPLLDILCEASF